MSVRRGALASLLAIAALRCTETGRPDPSSASAASADPHLDTVHRGLLVYGHEARTFMPCGGGEEAWVEDRTPTGELGQVYGRLAQTPYERIFFEVLGTYAPSPNEGFGAEYPRMLVVTALRHAVGEGPKCDEPTWGFEFRAKGQEPFWSATIAPSGISVARPDESPLVFPYAVPAEGAVGAALYRSVRELPHAEITIELRPAPCRDSMAAEHYGHTARVLLDGREMAGCAYPGLPPSGAPLDASIRTFEKKLTGCGADGSEVCAWFRFEYPAIRSGLPEPARRAVAAVIDAWIAAPLGEGGEAAAPDELMRAFEQDWTDFKRRFPDSAQRRLIQRTASVLASGPDWVSLELRQRADLGGAHPNETVMLRSHERRSGERIELDSILRAGARGALDELAEAELRRTKGLPPDTSLTDAGYWFEGGRFGLNDNFALTPSGLRFRFDPYEIAPYAAGSTTIDLPWALVEPLLVEKEKGRLVRGALE